MNALLLLAALASPAAAPAPLPDLFSYEIVESSRSTTPAGERHSAVVGSVEVAGERGRLVLASGRLPRAKGSELFWKRDTLTLHDSSTKSYADVPRAELDSLFTSEPAGASGPLASSFRDVSVKLSPAGEGVFEERTTRVFTIEVSYSLLVTAPGRTTRVKTTGKARIETLDEPGAASPLDDVSRLFGLRGVVRESLEKELSALSGLPVSFRYEATSESTTEAIGLAPLPEGSGRPLKSTRLAERKLRGLSRRKGTREDVTRLSPPAGSRSVPLERLRFGATDLP